MTDTPTCAVPNCTPPYTGRMKHGPDGVLWCNRHHSQWSKTGDVRGAAFRAVCQHPDGCDRAWHRPWPKKYIGLCEPHWLEVRTGRQSPQCEQDGCEQPSSEGLSLCAVHAGSVCLRDGCGRAATGRGFCNTHLRALHRHDHPDGAKAAEPALMSLRDVTVSVAPLRALKAQRGSLRRMLRGDLMPGTDAHERLLIRLRRALGSEDNNDAILSGQMPEREITMEAADDIAVNGLGMHPAHVWGAAWWQARSLYFPPNRDVTLDRPASVEPVLPNRLYRCEVDGRDVVLKLTSAPEDEGLPEGSQTLHAALGGQMQRVGLLSGANAFVWDELPVAVRSVVEKAVDVLLAEALEQVAA